MANLSDVAATGYGTLVGAGASVLTTPPIGGGIGTAAGLGASIYLNENVQSVHPGDILNIEVTVCQNPDSDSGISTTTSMTVVPTGGM